MKIMQIFVVALACINLSAREVTLVHKNFKPPIKLDQQYYRHICNIPKPGFLYNSEARFTAALTITGKDGARAGLKLGQSYFNEKDFVFSTFFWNRVSEGENQILKGETKLDAAFPAADLIKLVLYAYRSNHQGTLEISDVSLEVELEEPEAPAFPLEDLFFEKVFDPPAVVETYYRNLTSIPLKEQKFTRDSLFTAVVKLRSEGGARAGLKMRQLSHGRTEASFSSFFWSRFLADQEQTLTGSCRISSEHNPEDIKALQIYAYNCNTSGKLLIDSVQLFVTEEKAPPPKQDPIPRETYTHMRRKPDFFPTGVYLYGSPSELEKIAAHQNVSLIEYFHKIFQDLTDHGCNSVYLANLTMTPEVFRQACEIADSHDIKVFAQGTRDLYIRATRGPEYFAELTAPASRKILPQYNDIPNFAGYLNVEEVPARAESIELMRAGRQLAKELMPNIPIFMLHNNIKSMELDDEEPQPDWYGFDRYRFRHVEAYGEYLISTPSDMVRLLYREINEFYQFAAKRGIPMIFVGQGYKQEEFHRQNLSAASGFREVSPGVWRGYGRYMPRNGMNLQFYLSVAAGARGFLLYFYQSFLPREGATSRSDALLTLEGKETWYWQEIGQCLNEVKPLLPLFSSWFREVESHAQADDPRVLTPSFIRPDIEGRFFLPVNTHIADWDGNNPIRSNVKTQLYSDAENLQGFKWVGSKRFKLSLQESGELWRVTDGKKVDPEAVELPPGKGVVLFQGDLSQLKKIRKELRLLEFSSEVLSHEQ